MKKSSTIAIIALSILLVGLYTVTSTYSVIIDVIENNGVMEIVNKIKVRDLLVNDNGSYNKTYYDIKNELEATAEEANILINSKPINEALQSVLKSIVDYKVGNKPEAKLSDEEIYNLITQSVLDTNNISDDLKSRIINKASKYRKDVSKYIYDIEVSLLGENIWIFTSCILWFLL